tara:strand:- start:295 stop:498 length:204 start_codon:yes stop_codon:yes gene_type:complete
MFKKVFLKIKKIGKLERAPFCPITGVTDERLLQAAHIKPWKDSTPEEKVDACNGIMLTLTIHKLSNC